MSLLPALLAAALSAATPLPGEEAITFTARSGDSVEAFAGAFDVPERRADPDSRTITLRYVRFPATGEQPGAPIVYLSGGPGGSGIGTAKGPRFPLFMAMREHGDVIAFDQRGTGASDDMPECVSSQIVPADEPIGDARLTAYHRAAALECAAFWEEAGIDLAGYTTAESAEDLSALRRHLGAERVSLWGISYGSHLALAAIKSMEDELDRVILASAEGLDQTVKLPARTDAYFERLQAAVDSQPAAAAAYGDIVSMMRRVHARLDAAPLELRLRLADGRTDVVLFDRPSMQRTASFLIADPGRAALLLRLYRDIDRGETAFLTALSERYHQEDEPIDFRAMPLAMDLASGISQERRAVFESQAPVSLLGGYLNFPMPQLDGVFPDLRLGEDFRAPAFSSVPTLLLTGTLDGRTYPEGQAEAVRGLSNLTQVTIVNAGHNLFMTDPAVGGVMHRFMRGEPVGTARIETVLPDLLDE